MTSKSRCFDADASFSVSEALRPPRGARVVRVAVLSYSVDLVALTALILALARSGEEDLTAGPLALVDALREVAPGLVVIYQRDRLVAAPRHFGVLHLLDRRLRPIQPARGASWHPKLVLARYEGDPDVRWRLWAGSRNLTGSRDREAGVVLDGAARAPGRFRPDVGVMLRTLLRESGWPETIFAELDGLRWRSPPDAVLRGVEWRRDGEDRPFLGEGPKAASTLIVSPFVDERGLDHLLPTGHAPATLVTTSQAAVSLQPRERLDIRCVDEPPRDRAVVLGEPEPADGFGADAPSGGSLHAKLVLRRTRRDARLWIGSANATGRGLLGPNAELMIELAVTDDVADGLWDWALAIPPARERDEDPDRIALEAARRRLDLALREVTDADFRLEVGSDFRLTVDRRLDGFLRGHLLQVRTLTAASWSEWRIGETEVVLAQEPPSVASRTTLVCFDAQTRDDARVRRSWAQPVSFPQLDLTARDLAATAAYVGAGRLAQWLRSRLEGRAPEEGLDWTGAPRGAAASVGAAAAGESPLSLEAVLAAWARDPSEFEARIGEIDRTLAAFRRELADDKSDGARVAREQLAAIRPFWTAVKVSLKARRGA